MYSSVVNRDKHSHRKNEWINLYLNYVLVLLYICLIFFLIKCGSTKSSSAILISAIAAAQKHCRFHQINSTISARFVEFPKWFHSIHDASRCVNAKWNHVNYSITSFAWGYFLCRFSHCYSNSHSHFHLIGSDCDIFCPLRSINCLFQTHLTLSQMNESYNFLLRDERMSACAQKCIKLNQKKSQFALTSSLLHISDDSPMRFFGTEQHECRRLFPSAAFFVGWQMCGRGPNTIVDEGNWLNSLPICFRTSEHKLNQRIGKKCKCNSLVCLLALSLSLSLDPIPNSTASGKCNFSLLDGVLCQCVVEFDFSIQINPLDLEMHSIGNLFSVFVARSSRCSGILSVPNGK